MFILFVQTPLFRLHQFPSGVLVVQLKTHSVEKTVPATAEFVKLNGLANASQLADAQGITVILAKERLLAAEEKTLLCRDDSVEGLFFYPNKFLET